MRRKFISFLLLTAACNKSAIAIKPSTFSKASRSIRKFLTKLKKPAAEITTSVLTNVISKKVMDALENADENSPLPTIATYCSLISEHRINDAQSCWLNPPGSHFFEKIFLSDIQELYRSGNTSSVLVEISGGKYSQPSENYSGTVNLYFIDNHWLIKSIRLLKS